MLTQIPDNLSMHLSLPLRTFFEKTRWFFPAAPYLCARESDRKSHRTADRKTDRTADRNADQKHGQRRADYYFIPAKVWRRHAVMAILGWSQDYGRFRSSANRMVLPCDPLEAVLSGLALACSEASLSSSQRERRNRDATRQLDMLFHQYKNHDWTPRQIRYGEDKDWLAERVRRMQQFMRMSLDRKYASSVKQRSLSASDPLNPVVMLSHILFSADVPRAKRQMRVLEEELQHGPRVSYGRILDLCIESHKSGEAVGKLDALRYDAYRLVRRAWEAEDQIAILYGLEKDLYRLSMHADLVTEIGNWLDLAATYPREVVAGAEREEQAERCGTLAFFRRSFPLCR